MSPQAHDFGNGPRGRRRWLLTAAALILAGAASVLIVQQRAQRQRLESRLLSTYPQDVMAHPDLVRFAVAQARPLFAARCAACHGRDLRGNATIGAANLTDDDWLWGKGTVFQIERIILYGIRSGQSKALDVTEMPAFGLMGRLSDAQVHDLVEYLLELNHRPYDVGAANQGRALFFSDKTSCYDCHGSDAHGNPDYGAPNLTVNDWNNGGDPQSLYDSIYYGRHRIMPAWQGVLTLEQIRALAVYVHTVSHPAEHAADNGVPAGGRPQPTVLD